jgi:DNA (cytosine-5)-methyltransferase 1
VTRPKLLDLCCRAGGASAGYHRAGFDVTGVDLHPKFAKQYPFTYIAADALEYLAEHGREYQAIAASPPCQRWTKAQRVQNREHPDLLTPLRELILDTGLPYIIENVPGAPLKNPVMLCGNMFPELNVYRHRLFESNVTLTVPEHPDHVEPLTKMGRAPVPGERMFIVGNFIGAAEGRKAMGIDWFMARDNVREAIPPAYTHHLGQQLLEVVKGWLEALTAAPHRRGGIVKPPRAYSPATTFCTNATTASGLK